MKKVDLLYRTHRTQPFEVEAGEPVLVIEGPRALYRQRAALARWSTPPERIKLAVKIAVGRSVFFAIGQPGGLATTGVLALGYCSYYPVEPEAVVITSLETDPARRGEGLATRAIKGAMNAMIARGRTLFYIDTQKGNIAMQRSIEKLGFGPPLAGR